MLYLLLIRNTIFYLGLVSPWSRHDPAQNLHFLLHHRSLLYIGVEDHLRHLRSDEERGEEETKYEAETWRVQL